MSLSAISTTLSTILPSVSFHPHGHRKGSQPNSVGGSTSSIGQLPVGAASSLFGNLLQSLQQTIGAQSASSSSASAVAANPVAAPSAQSPGQQQELQAFTSSLFQALKQDGFTPASGVASATGASTTASYQGSLVSSLQTLVQQLGSSGPTTSTNTTLNATFQNFVNGASAAPTVSTDPSDKTALQSFLNNLLQNLQSGGVQSLSGTGNTVNAKV